jgi:pimeloyl-ACP methyl ester carboxylesterase
MSAARLTPAEMYPAGIPGIAARFIKTASGIRVRVVESGPDDGPPIVLLTGWGGCVYAYRKNIPALAAAGLRVIAVDMKGQGLSDKPSDPTEYTLPGMTSHVIEVLDALGLKRTRLVGQSMAGKIAAQAALEAPARVERLALIGAVGVGRVSGAALLGRLPLRSFDLLDSVTSRWTFRAVLHRAYGSLGKPTARDVEEYYAPTSDPNFVRALFLLLKEFDWRLFTPEELARFTMPVLIICGSEERIVTSDRAGRVAARMPDARVVMVEGAGHVVNEEAPEQSNQALVEFFAP